MKNQLGINDSQQNFRTQNNNSSTQGGHHVKFQQQQFTEETNEDDEIVISPNKMLDNKNQRFYMTFNNNKGKSMEFMWNRLSGIICNKRPKEYNKFMKKVEIMQQAVQPKQTPQKGLRPRTISSTKKQVIQNKQHQNDSQTMLSLARYQSVNASIQKSPASQLQQLQVNYQPTELLQSRRRSINESNHPTDMALDSQQQAMLQLNLFTLRNRNEQLQRLKDEEILDEFLEVGSKKGLNDQNKKTMLNGDMNLKESIKRQERVLKNIIMNKAQTSRSKLNFNNNQDIMFSETFDEDLAQRFVIKNTSRFNLQQMLNKQPNQSQHTKYLSQSNMNLNSDQSQTRRSQLPYFSINLQNEFNDEEQVIFQTPTKTLITPSFNYNYRVQSSKTQRNRKTITTSADTYKNANSFSFSFKKGQTLNKDLLSTHYKVEEDSHTLLGQTKLKEYNSRYDDQDQSNQKGYMNTLIKDWDSVGADISGSNIPINQSRKKHLCNINNFINQSKQENSQEKDNDDDYDNIKIQLQPLSVKNIIQRPKTAGKPRQVQIDVPSKNYYKKQEMLYGVQQINTHEKSLKQRAMEELIKMEQENNQVTIIKDKKRLYLNGKS